MNAPAFGPSDVQAVLVIAAVDPGRVDRLLRPRYGDSLCVIASRWARAVIDTVRGQLHQRREAWGVWFVGNSSTAAFLGVWRWSASGSRTGALVIGAAPSGGLPLPDLRPTSPFAKSTFQELAGF